MDKPEVIILETILEISKGIPSISIDELILNSQLNSKFAVHLLRKISNKSKAQSLSIIDEIIAQLKSGGVSTSSSTDLVVQNLTVEQNITCNESIVAKFLDLNLGISFISCPVGYILQMSGSNDINNATVSNYWPILASQGRVLKETESQDNGYIINPGFTIVIYTDIYFNGYSIGPYTNDTSVPIFIKASPGDDKNLKSIIVYYKGLLWNPMGYTIPSSVSSTYP